MAIIAGYTKESDDEYVVIGSYDNPTLAEDAIESDTSSDVKHYWVASFVHPDTGEPEVLAHIEP